MEKRRKTTSKPTPSRQGKTTKETTKPTAEVDVPHGNIPTLIPRPNGKGALNSGGTPGNAGGTGRPKDRIRAILTGHYEKNLAVVDDIATGKVMQTMEIPVIALLKHVKCPQCGGGLKPKDVESLFETVKVKVSASPKDRLGAVDHQARYSIGAVKEISVDNVRERLEQQITLLQTRFTGVVLENLLADLRAIWNS